MQADLAIVGGTVVTGSATTRADVLVRDGRIGGVVEPGAAAAPVTVDAAGLLVLPGFVDTTST